MDSVFFSQTIIELLDSLGVEYTSNVPCGSQSCVLERRIDECKRWHRLHVMAGYFEKRLALDSWNIRAHRFLFIRTSRKAQSKGAVQFDLLEPHDFNY